MSIVTKDEILKEIEVGNIEITPFRRDQVGLASIDLHLGNDFGMFKRSYQTVPLDEEANTEKDVLERKFVKSGNQFLL